VKVGDGSQPLRQALIRVLLAITSVALFGGARRGSSGPAMSLKIKHMRAEHLTKPGHRKHSLCEARHKGVVVKNRPLQDGHGTDRKAYVPVGILGFEEPCV
jgi:hypothetical protein